MITSVTDSDSQSFSNNQQSNNSHSQKVNPTSQLEAFDSVRQNALFKKLEQKRFSGQVHLNFEQGKPWTLLLHLGRIVYGTGGNSSTRRWKRNIESHLQNIQTELSLDSFGNCSELANICWEYATLLLLVENQEIGREEANQIIQEILSEIFFDFHQLQYKSCKLQTQYSLSTQLALIKPKEVIFRAWTNWQKWEDAGLAEFSPSDFPIIQNPEKLKQETSPKTHQILSKLLDGQRSIRDIARITKRDMVTIASSIKPYLVSGIIELQTIDDLPRPSFAVPQKSPPVTPQPATFNAEPPLIACVDDSPAICQTMEKIITKAGYRFLGINDGVRALASLLRHKPDFIFLDLVMPVINGYEVCSKLRRIPDFRDIPIIILTGNDGVVDRFRAKLIGSTDFISKPVEVGVVLEMLEKHINVK